MAPRRRNAPAIVFAAALLAMAIVLVVAQWRITFFQDTFAFLLDRQPWTAHSFLVPHNEHIVVIPVLITKTLLAVFGMSSNVPEQLVMGITVLAAPTLLLLWLRRRLDPWLATILAVLFLFLGSAWSTILWPFEDVFTLPVVFGLAALLLLDRDDAAGDRWACLMLVLATISGSLGICFVAAAFVDLLLKARGRGRRRAYVFALPLLIYVAWYVGWGHTAEHHVTLTNVLRSPWYVMEGFASSLDSLAGLSTITPTSVDSGNVWGRPLLIAAIGLAILGQWRRPGFSRTFWVVAAAGLSYWLLAAFNFEPGREPYTGRYVYGGALFLLLMAAELLRTWRFGGRAPWIAAGVAVLAILPNLAQLKEGADWEKEQSVLTRADIGALEIARDTVAPAYQLLSVPSTGTASLGLVQARSWFEAVDKWGTPADSPSRIENEPEVGREHADLVLAEALPITSTYAPGGLRSEAPAGKSCVTLPGGGASAGREVRLGPGTATVEIAAGGEPKIGLRRFAAEKFPVTIKGAPGGSIMSVEIPADRASRPWFMHVEAEQTTRVCAG